MPTRWHVLLLVALVCAVPAGAQSGGGVYGTNHAPTKMCPWLTAGTAASALGGDVNATVSITNVTEGTCRFARRGETTDFLEIRVSAAPLAACPADSAPLHGIGNEAVRCRVSGSRGEEMASGRVREVYFTVLTGARSQKRGTKPPHPDDDTLARIADEVAGNLY